MIRQDGDSSFVPGGLCRVRRNDVVILNSKATVKDKIRILGTAIEHFNLDQIYMRSALRKFLDNLPEQKPFTRCLDKTRII